MSDRPPPPHGITRYRKYGCRCDECRAAIRDYMRFYRGSQVTAPVAVSWAARERAIRRLIDLHQADYDRLLQDEAAREVAS